MSSENHFCGECIFFVEEGDEVNGNCYAMPPKMILLHCGEIIESRPKVRVDHQACQFFKRAYRE